MELARRKSEAVALVALGRALLDAGYMFVTVTPETHRRVSARATERGSRNAVSLRDAFGWSRPFERSILPALMMELACAAGVVVEDGPLLRSTVRFSTLKGKLFVHSAYPTIASGAVFFGPDTYRFCALLDEELAGRGRARCVVDVGCGSGAGGIVAAAYAERVIFADINGAALAFAEVNAALAELNGRWCTAPCSRSSQTSWESTPADRWSGNRSRWET